MRKIFFLNEETFVCSNRMIELFFRLVIEEKVFMVYFGVVQKWLLCDFSCNDDLPPCILRPGKYLILLEERSHCLQV